MEEDEGDDDDDEEEDEDDDDQEEEEGESYDDENVSVSSRKKVYTEEEKEAEALAIGYKVIGPLDKDERVFKSYEPVFAVVQVFNMLNCVFFFFVYQCFNFLFPFGDCGFFLLFLDIDWVAPV